MTKVCLDAGHYGKYNRSPANKDYYESDMVWKLHLMLKKYLESYEIEVITTRSKQSDDLGLYNRGAMSKGCNLFISLHSNAVDSGINEKIDYPVAYAAINGKADKIATLLADCVEDVMGTAEKARIEHRTGSSGADYYGVVRGATAVGTPGLILEHSFHTQTRATNWLLNDSNLDKLARAEAAVIAEYYGLGKSLSEWIPTGTATCTGNGVRFRRTPDGEIVTFLDAGQRFEVDGLKSGKWVHAMVDKHGVGYIFEDYVKYDESAQLKPELNFKDVKSDDFYYDAVNWAVENDITQGITDSKFCPINRCTRGDAVAFIWRAKGKPEPRINKCPFEDVSSDAFYYKAILWAVENGIVAGVSDTKFVPNENVTRAQFISMMYRATGSPNVATSSQFPDVVDDDWYASAVSWATLNKIVSGYSNGKFGPHDPCTRGQVVTFLYRAR